MEVANRDMAQDCKILWRNHPIITASHKDISYPVHGDLSIRKVLINSGIDINQPILVVLDDKLLTVKEWDSVSPKVGQIINVQSAVMGGGGGGGGSNPLQTVAMIALVVAVTYFSMGTATGFMGAYTAAGLGLSSFTGAMIAGAAMIAGSMVINSVFSASNNATSLSGASGTYAEASPTYSLSGGSNRIRPYESMPVVFGSHQLFPDLASKPYTEYQGEDQYLYQIFHFGLSDVELSNFKIGTTDLSDFSDYEWCLPDASGRINRFPGNVDSISGATLDAASGWITRTTSKDTYRIGIDIEGMLYYANNAGGLDSTSVTIRIQYKPTNSTTWIDPSVITTQSSGFAVGHYESYSYQVPQGEWQSTYDYDGNSTQSYVDTSYVATGTRFVSGGGTVIVSGASQTARRATLYIDVPVDEYDVRIIRDTADSTDSRLQNKTSWGTLRSYQLDSASYVGQNRRGLIIRASSQLNGAVSRLSCLANAKANYFDGTSWVYGATSNPAHWFMDFCIGRRSANGVLMYGAGKRASELDLPELVDWANFCNSEGLTFNAVLDGNQTIEDYLNAIAKCGFGSVSRASGKLGVVWDRRSSSPVAAFGMSNILNGSFSVSYTNENLAEEIVCKYVNPLNDWNQDEVRQNSPGITDPLRTSTIDLYGCTSKSMAGKFANYFSAQQFYRKRRISWDCDFEGFVCQRGDVALLSHDLTQWGYSGRIVSHTNGTLKLDRSVPRSASTDYLMIRSPDGSMTTYSVESGVGEQDELTLATIPEFQDGFLDMDHMWFFSPLQTTGKLVKILSVKPTSDSRVSIVATDENPEFYTAWDGAFNSPAPSSLLLGGTPAISNISISESLYRKSAGIVSKVTISFSVSGAYDHSSIRHRINGGQWTKGVTYSTSFNFDANEAGTLDVEITPIGGLKSGVTAYKTIQIFGLSMPPSNVLGMHVVDIGISKVLMFDQCNDIDWSYTEIRTGNSWDDSELISKAKSTNVTLPLLIAGDHKVFAKHVDLFGSYSEIASSFTLVINGPSAPIDFSVSIAGEDLVAHVTQPDATSYQIASYTITYDDGLKSSTFLSDTFKFHPSTMASKAGSHEYSITTLDIAGNTSPQKSFTLVINGPKTPSISPSTIDNTVLLKWTDSTTSFPVDRYEVRRGDVYASSADVVTGSNARFATFLELVSWTYKYWVTAVDVFGNKSTPAMCFGTVRQPNDYVLQSSYTLNGFGAGSGFSSKNGVIYMPIINETFQDHFLTHSANNAQELVDIGLSAYCSPTGSEAIYSEVIDFRSVISSATIGFNYMDTPCFGEVNVSVKLYSKALESDEWGLLPNSYQCEAANFRYVKVEFIGSSVGDLNLSKISNAVVQVVVRSITDSGKSTALSTDINGTVVSFNKIFSDCQTPIVQANSNVALIPVVNFEDIPNPISFSVFFYDLAGNRVTTDFSWNVTGV